MKSIILTLSLLIVSSSMMSQKQFKKNRKTVQKIQSLTQENIYNAKLLETQEYQEFISYITSQEVLSLDTFEFAKAFNRKANTLSFSHYYLGTKNKKKNSKKKKVVPFELEELSQETVMLHLRKFVADGAAMTKIVQEISQKGYKNLIIDLRNNSGGTLDAAVILGRFLTNQTIDAGAYVTRKWYDEMGETPSLEEIQKFKFLGGFTYKDFQDIQEELAFRMVLPGHSNATFQGEVFVLTNNQTASACEPFVHVLKTHNAAQIIGETTAGQMLSANWFKVNKDISIFIPVNDYLTAEGTRLDQIGVKPHIEIDADKALQTALDSID